jgi:hypothetical protein
MHKQSPLKVLALVVLITSALAASSSAAMITFDLSVNISGGPTPTGTPPWLTATFQDGMNNGTQGVFLTLQTPGMQTGEKIQDWYFNLDPSLNPNSLTFLQTDKTGTFSDPGYTTGVNNQNAPAAMGFDIKVGFSTSNADAFGAGDSVEIFISGIAGLDAYDFNFLSTSGYNSAAHYLAVVPSDGSVTIGAVPEPSHAIIGALLLGGLVWVERGRIRSFFRKKDEKAT